MPKRSIRAQFLSERRALKLEICIAKSAEIQHKFLLSEQFHCADCLALYSTIHNEVLTEVVARQALKAGKTLVYPRVKNDDLEFVEVLDLTELVPGTFGVLESQGNRLVPVEELDLVVVPGVAFDLAGHRLGYGRGFYDRALLACRSDCTKVGFAYDSQLLAALPSAKHDQKLSMLMTEQRTLNFIA
jgi:5-formyltetrahydrofolate cyclo-ligase